MDFDVSVIVNALPALLQGAKLTVLITVAGLLGGTVVGLVFGLMRAYGNRLLNTLGFLYIELVRGTPIVVQVMDPHLKPGLTEFVAQSNRCRIIALRNKIKGGTKS